MPLEEDAQIVAGTLKGEAEIRAGLGNQFKNVDDFIEYFGNAKKDRIGLQVIHTG